MCRGDGSTCADIVRGKHSCCVAASRLVAGVAMARSSKLEGRVRAIFDQTRSHSPLDRHTSRCMLALVLTLAAAVAAVRPGGSG